MTHRPPSLHWLSPGEAFPDIRNTWDRRSPAPGLLAAGGALDVETLRTAYEQGIFPWFSDGQPILWWSPDPRMVLPVAEFRLHRSLRKSLNRFRDDPRCAIRIDTAFSEVIHACATSPRDGQAGTWIVPQMVQAYSALHQSGHAHSIETWIDGRLAGGLYCVAIGRAVFGESMFTRETDASKIALAALVALCRRNGVRLIDCQQNTKHLLSLGAREVDRAGFLAHLRHAGGLADMQWHFDPVYWRELFGASA